MRVLHVIPVPDGMTAEEAWAEIRTFDRLAEGRVVSEAGEGGGWAVIEDEYEEPDIPTWGPVLPGDESGGSQNDS